MSRSTGDLLGALTRDESTRILATLIRLTGDITLAEDALQDAMVRALTTWDSTGIPDNPRAWVIVTARRCAVDRIRREARRTDKEVSAMVLFDEREDPSESVVRDDLLRLVFTCCHPSLSLDARVALSPGPPSAALTFTVNGFCGCRRERGTQCLLVLRTCWCFGRQRPQWLSPPSGRGRDHAAGQPWRYSHRT